MVAALQSRDSSYAQRFIVAVRTTKIYCVPGCPAPPPKPENVDFVASPEEARALGCRACKRCHPDLSFLGIPHDEARYEALLREVTAHPEAFEGVEAMAKAAQVGISRLHEGFRVAYHRTPLEALTAAKVSRAASLLLREGSQAGAVGLDAGFASSSVFYEQFGRAMGMTPAAYGRLRTARSFCLELPGEFPVEAFRSYLERDEVDPLLVRIGMGYAMRLGSGGLMRFSLSSSGLEVEVDREGDAPSAHARLVRLMGTEAGLAGLKQAARLVGSYAGLRVFQTVDFFDAVVWAIVGQQLTLSFAKKLRRRVYDLLREGEPPFVPLRAAEVAGLSEEALLAQQFSARKAEYLLTAARELSALDLEDVLEWPISKVERLLRGLRGFGPWSTNYVLMRACGFADCVPIGDSGLATALHRFFSLEARPGPKEQAELMAQFTPYRSLATYHLWHSPKVVA
jgi:AraC family transcriptional regulator of adaptative response / DNA-3-methyladenine glycosylase II